MSNGGRSSCLRSGSFRRSRVSRSRPFAFTTNQDLLIPSVVDEATGYRYYDRSKIELARIITQLRSLELSLEEIGEILRAAGEDADLRDVMVRQKSLIEAKIRRYREIANSLQQFLNHEEETRRIMKNATFQIEEKTAPTILVAGIRRQGPLRGLLPLICQDWQAVRPAHQRQAFAASI